MPISQEELNKIINKIRYDEEMFRRLAEDVQRVHNHELLEKSLDESYDREDDLAEQEHLERVRILHDENAKEFHGYETLFSILLQIARLYSKLAPILNYQIAGVLTEIINMPLNVAFGTDLKSVVRATKKLKDLAFADNPKSLVLPVITHSLTAEKDQSFPGTPNAVKVNLQPLLFLQDVITKQVLAEYTTKSRHHPFRTEDPQKYHAELNEDFLMVVNGWLFLHNTPHHLDLETGHVYVLDPRTMCINGTTSTVNPDGTVNYLRDLQTGKIAGATPITVQDFEKLRDAPDTGLTAYLQKNLKMESELTLEENPRPKPSFG